MKRVIGKQLPLTVYSSKTQNVRSIVIEPSDTWGGQGLLGISIRFCSFEGANENVWHILEVHPSSPADLAGLRPFTDYIIGADAVLHESEDLYTLVESHENRCLKLYVYNSQEDSCREVTITPNSKWGGEGSLGCGIGYGYLHRIPVRGNLPESTVEQVYIPNTSCSSETSHLICAIDSDNNTPQNNQISVSSGEAMTVNNFVITNGQQTVQNVALSSSIGEYASDNNLSTVNTVNLLHANETVSNAASASNTISPAYSESNINIQTTVPNPSNISFAAPQHTQTIPSTQFNQTINPVYYPPTSDLPVHSHTFESTNQAFNTDRFTQPLYTSATGTILPPPLSGFQPPPLSGFQPQSHLIYDPTIAAMSAQKLLNSSNPASS